MSSIVSAAIGVFGSLLGAAVGSYATASIAEKHAQEKERKQIVEALASVRTELLVGVNRLAASVLSANMAMKAGHIPEVTDDLTLMYRTHASVMHAHLSANEVLFITVAYSSLWTYAKGRNIAGHPSPVAFVYGLYMNTLNAMYNAYMMLGQTLHARYQSRTPQDLAVFYLPAHGIEVACEGAESKAEESSNENDSRQDIHAVKMFAISLIAELKKNGFEVTNLDEHSDLQKSRAVVHEGSS